MGGEKDWLHPLSLLTSMANLLALVAPDWFISLASYVVSEGTLTEYRGVMDYVVWPLLQIALMLFIVATLVAYLVYAERKISANIVQAIDLAKARSAKVFGIVGRDSGYTAKHGDVVVLIPQVNPSWVTPLSEAFQAVVWHCLVSHPALQRRQTKW